VSIEYDVIIRDGTIYDGSGGPPFTGDIAIKGERIVAVGDHRADSGHLEIDASGLAVAPGFINMLSWACESLIEDGLSQSDIRQGVTLEVMGESFSYGPLNEAMKEEMRQRQSDIRFEIAWTTLDEYLNYLVKRGVSTNVASFVGTGTLRTHVVGYDDRPATPEELERMCALVKDAMGAGALGLASALIYVPDCFNRPEELFQMARVVGKYDGLYISHLRSEGVGLLEGVEELIQTARQATVRAEIYHLKASGMRNWSKLGAAIEKIEAAQDEGLSITADMYPYIASATGLDVTMPPWVQEGGHEAWVKRLRDPQIRQRVRLEMNAYSDRWENGFLEARSPENILLVGFKNPALKYLTGKTVAEVAAMRGTSAEDTIMDLVVEDDSRVGAIFFSMSEENVRRQIRLPWVSFGSDEASLAPEGVFLLSNPHPRAYGTFARLLGRYVRDEKIIPLEEAVRRLTSLPAANLRLDRRGALKAGYYADLAIFDPMTIQDHATFESPHQYASGMAHVFVNGIQALRDGEHTGAKPGQIVRGPGWQEHI
jgi:N-acyl-D-amino-acid deacylase